MDWFVNKVEKLENKTVFFSIKINKKDIIMTEKDEEYNRNIKTCGFCEKKSNRLMLEINVICQVNVEDQAIVFVILMSHRKVVFLSQFFHKFSNYVCDMFFKGLADKKMMKKSLRLYLRQMKKIYQ